MNRTGVRRDSRLRTAVLCLGVSVLQAGVFFLVPVLNRFYDGWPRGWIVLSVSILAALFGGLAAGLTALFTGILLIFWLGTYFRPMHPGLEIFAALGLVQIIVIHRLRRARAELQERHDALEAEHKRANELSELAHEANRAKDEFMAVLSHELRTPLNVILGYSRMLRERIATPEFVRRASEIIESNAVAQVRIVEDLLDVQRLKSGIRLEPALFDLRKLGESVLESLRPAADAKGLHWSGQFDPITVEGDPARMQQALWNVLSNAIKFTPEGGCIGISGVCENGHVAITVEDSGEGIPPEFLPYVFEPFRQLDMTNTRRHGGLGLGLSIVKNIVEAHGGSVSAESSGKGSRFTLRFPVRLSSSRDAEAEGAASQES